MFTSVAKKLYEIVSVESASRINLACGLIDHTTLDIAKMGKCSRGSSAAAVLLLFLASCAPLKLCLGSLQPDPNQPNGPPVDPTAAAGTATSTTPSARVNEASPPVDPTSAAAAATTTPPGAAGAPTPMVRAPIPMRVPHQGRSDLPDSDAFGKAQAHMLNELPPHPTLVDVARAAAIATFQDDGSTASILALFNHPYTSDVLRNFFDPTQPNRAELLRRYRFVRGRRVNGPFTPMCQTSNTEYDRLHTREGTFKVGKLVQKADVILHRMPAATNRLRQLTVREIVTLPECDSVPIPVSSAGRHVLRQSTFNSCGATCVAMVGLDLGCRMPPHCDFEAENAAGSTAPWVKERLERYCGDKISVTESSPKDDNWLYIIMWVSSHVTLVSNGHGREPGEGGAGVPMTMRDPMCGIEFIVTAEDLEDYFLTNMIADVDRAVLSIHLRVPDVAPPVPAVPAMATAGPVTLPDAGQSPRDSPRPAQSLPVLTVNTSAAAPTNPATSPPSALPVTKSTSTPT